jgi:regulator of cell morphogenesis and NO signaling
MRQHDSISYLFEPIVYSLYQMNESIGQLREEHRFLQVSLQELSLLAREMERKTVVSLEDDTLRNLKIKGFAFKRDLDNHAVWEEQVLFPMIAWYLGEEPEQLTLMEQDHVIADSYIQAFLDVLERLPVRNNEDQAMANCLSQAKVILNDHFRLEEEVLVKLLDCSNSVDY